MLSKNKVNKFLMWTVILTVIDIVMTYVFVYALDGFRELNPIVLYFMDMGLGWFFGINVVVTILFVTLFKFVVYLVNWTKIKKLVYVVYFWGGFTLLTGLIAIISNTYQIVRSII